MPRTATRPQRSRGARVGAPPATRRARGVGRRRWPSALGAADEGTGAHVERGIADVGSSAVGRRVLVVDDESSVRMICRFNLLAAGMEVREAADGRQALALIREDAPDIVLLDVMMPELDG